MNTNRFKRKKIIDRTLPEVYGAHRKISRLDILNLCWMLNTLGVDIIEINLELLRKIGRLPAELSFLYRIDSEAALDSLPLHPLTDIVIPHEIPQFNHIIDQLQSTDRKITVEFRAESVREIYRLKRLKQVHWLRTVKTIRVVGLNRFVTNVWLEGIEYIQKNLNVNIDLCPENLFYHATAAAVDGLKRTADYITATFMGYGGVSGYAAVEQVMTFAKVILDPVAKAQLNILPKLAKSFSEAAGVEIPDNMPVIGKNIFAYESGIHADGICKNPMTYEPYDPAMVGRERKLSIGKHSGTRSIVKKLQELGVEMGNIHVSDLLHVIREKSILLHRNLEDNEILDLLKLPAASVK